MIKSVVNSDIKTYPNDLPQVKSYCNLYTKQEDSDYHVGDMKSETDAAIELGTTIVEVPQNAVNSSEPTSKTHDQMHQKIPPDIEKVYIKEEPQEQEIIIKTEDGNGISDLNSSLDETITSVSSGDSELFKCSHCPYETKNMQSLNLHVVLHRGPGAAWECSSCLYKTTRRNRYATHILKHMPQDEVRKFKCPEPGCSYKTYKTFNLSSHMLVHNVDSIFKCSQCPYQSKQKQSLTEHQRKHESIDKWLSCEQCPFKTTTKVRLRNHIQGHTDSVKVDWFKCDQCPFESVRKYSLQTHMKVHEKDQKKGWLNCPRCPFKTLWKRSLKLHQLKHEDDLGKKLHTCSHCSYKTVCTDYLRKHLLRNHSTHEGTDPDGQDKNDGLELLQCTECSYKSYKRRYIEKHMILHKNPIQM